MGYWLEITVVDIYITWENIQIIDPTTQKETTLMEL